MHFVYFKILAMADWTKNTNLPTYTVHTPRTRSRVKIAEQKNSSMDLWIHPRWKKIARVLKARKNSEIHVRAHTNTEVLMRTTPAEECFVFDPHYHYVTFRYCRNSHRFYRSLRNNEPCFFLSVSLNSPPHLLLQLHRSYYTGSTLSAPSTATATAITTSSCFLAKTLCPVGTLHEF